LRLTDKTAKMLRADLAEAGIPYVDDGLFFDFHAQRHQTGTLLAASGTHPKVAQSIMRHSDVKITMSTYSHLQDSDKAEAVSKLPAIKIIKPRQAKTGTCDMAEDLTANLTEPPLRFIKIQQNPVKGRFAQTRPRRT
jgi:hypothetical protein